MKNIKTISPDQLQSSRLEPAPAGGKLERKAPKPFPLPTTAVYAERIFEREGNLYLIRDTVDPATGHIRCQYATNTDRFRLEWTDCDEGVSFSEIEPVRLVAA